MMATNVTAKIIDGKEIAAKTRAELKVRVDGLKSAKGVTPGLAVVLVGVDPASKIYVRNKARASEKAGISSVQHTLDEGTTQDELLGLIGKLNADPAIHGILVQMPLPPHIDEALVIESILPEKDVDGFHPYNMGKLFTGSPQLVPCTPLGIMTLLESTGVELSGKDAVVLGRSNIVGKPMAMMLLKKNLTVTICHSKTTELAERVRAADVVVAAIGRANFVKGDWIKEGAIVIDVGINRREDGKLEGDVEFAGAAARASYITPVPGGVGPMTIAMLLENTYTAALKSGG